MPRDDKGKGKGKGSWWGGGGRRSDKGGGKGPADHGDKKSAWQCKHCQRIWNPKESAFCGGCGKPMSDCKRLASPDKNVTKLLNENQKLRKEFDEFKKQLNNNAPKQRAGGGGKGQGSGQGRVSGPGKGIGPPSHLPPDSPPPNASDSTPPRAASISPSQVSVLFRGQMVSLAELLKLLGRSNQPLRGARLGGGAATFHRKRS